VVWCGGSRTVSPRLLFHAASPQDRGPLLMRAGSLSLRAANGEDPLSMDPSMVREAD